MNTRGRSILGGLLAALLFLAVWLPQNRPVPPLETADLYGHLSVARHLTRGEGFRTDIAYPLSFAFPFARELPQPLIHRGPGFALLLTVPHSAAGQDPAATLSAVRLLQVILLAGLVWLGAWALLRRGRGVDVLPWLILLGANPLLEFAVNWGFEELAVGLLVLALWLRVRDGGGPGWPDGLLAGGLAMLRPELLWVPLLWWVWFAAERRRLDKTAARVFPWRRLALAVGLLLLLQVPWAVRNARLTGDPFFSLQSRAELVKDTRTWPGYSVYKQLDPQPVPQVLGRDPGPVLRKTARGLKFFVKETGKLLPTPYLVLGLLLVFGLLRGRVTASPCPFRSDRRPLSIVAEDFALGPLAAAMASLMLLAGTYSLFDHSLRHLLPLMPVLAWECTSLLGSAGLPVLERLPRLAAWLKRPLPALIAAALLTAALAAATHRETPGWDFARRQALSQANHRQEKTAAFATAPAESLFVDSVAVTWFADRPGVWDPGHPAIRQRIRGYLAED